MDDSRGRPSQTGLPVPIPFEFPVRRNLQNPRTGHSAEQGRRRARQRDCQQRRDLGLGPNPGPNQERIRELERGRPDRSGTVPVRRMRRLTRPVKAPSGSPRGSTRRSRRRPNPLDSGLNRVRCRRSHAPPCSARELAHTPSSGSSTIASISVVSAPELTSTASPTSRSRSAQIGLARSLIGGYHHPSGPCRQPEARSATATVPPTSRPPDPPRARASHEPASRTHGALARIGQPMNDQRSGSQTGSRPSGHPAGYQPGSRTGTRPGTGRAASCRPVRTSERCSRLLTAATGWAPAPASGRVGHGEAAPSGTLNGTASGMAGCDNGDVGPKPGPIPGPTPGLRCATSHSRRSIRVTRVVTWAATRRVTSPGFLGLLREDRGDRAA